MTDPTPTRDEAVLTGWKLVPVEPTPEMMAAGYMALLALGKRETAEQWKAMLASAPAPASGGVDAVSGSRSPQFLQGVRSAQKRAVAWLHERASSMKDPHAAAILNSAAFSYGQSAKLASLSPAATSVSEAGGEAARSWRRTKFEFIGAMRQALINSGLTREQVIIADNAITEAFSALAKPASSPAGVREAIELLSHLKLYVLEKLDADDADALQDRMHDLTAALSQSTSAGRVGE